MSRDFFGQPLAVKQRAAFSGPSGNRGWIKLGNEALDPGKPYDLKEAFNIGLELAPDDPEVLRTKLAGVPAKWYFSMKDATLMGFEVTADTDDDPCEVYLSDYAKEDGRMLPRKIEVRFGDKQYVPLDVASPVKRVSRIVENGDLCGILSSSKRWSALGPALALPPAFVGVIRATQQPAEIGRQVSALGEAEDGLQRIRLA